MSPTPFTFTKHGHARCGQRAILAAAIDAAVAWGLPRHVGNRCVAYHLGRRAVRRADRAGADVRRYERTVAVLHDGVVVTAWRGARPPRPRRRRGRRP